MTATFGKRESSVHRRQVSGEARVPVGARGADESLEDQFEATPAYGKAAISVLWNFVTKHPIASAFAMLVAIGAINKNTPSAQQAELATTARPVSGNCDGELEAVSRDYIRAWGFRCDTVDFCSRSSLDGNISMTCNMRYSYRVEDRGGNWVVILK